MTTLASKGGVSNCIVSERPDGVSLETWYTNGTDIFPGAVVTANGMSDPDMNLIDGAQEEFAGIAAERRDGTAQDPDTAMADNKPFLMAPRGCGMVVYVRFVTSHGALTPGEVLIHGGDGQGLGTLAANITTNDFTSFEDSWLAIIGTARDYVADQAATNFVRVRLCK